MAKPKYYFLHTGAIQLVYCVLALTAQMCRYRALYLVEHALVLTQSTLERPWWQWQVNVCGLLHAAGI